MKSLNPENTEELGGWDRMVDGRGRRLRVAPEWLVQGDWAQLWKQLLDLRPGMDADLTAPQL